MSTRTPLLLSMALTGLGLVGCGESAARDDGASAIVTCAADDAGAKTATKVYTFLHSAGAQSRVERTVRADGSETLRSETRVDLWVSGSQGGALPPSARPLQDGHAESPAPAGGVLREYAEIDAAGHLVYADVSVREGGKVLRRMILDPQHGAVLIRQADGPSGFMRAQADVPWLYAPLASTVTPVSAWIARRAADASPSVRVFDARDTESHDIMSDQLVLRDGRERFVILGDTLVSVDDEFVTSIPFAMLNPTPAPTACDDRADPSGLLERCG